MPHNGNQNNSPTIPSISIFRNRFSFIADPVLRDNLGIALQYIAFLLTLYSDKSLSGYLRYSIAKDIIVHSASIAEAICHNWVETLVIQSTLNIDEILKPSKKYQHLTDILTEDSGEKIIACRLKHQSVNLNGEVKFSDLIRGLKRAGKVDNSLFGKLDRLRDWRNQIHLKGLTSDSLKIFNSRQINTAFNTVKELINIVESQPGI